MRSVNFKLSKLAGARERYFCKADDEIPAQFEDDKRVLMGFKCTSRDAELRL